MPVLLYGCYFFVGGKQQVVRICMEAERVTTFVTYMSMISYTLLCTYGMREWTNFVGFGPS